MSRNTRTFDSILPVLENMFIAFRRGDIEAGNSLARQVLSEAEIYQNTLAPHEYSWLNARCFDWVAWVN